MTSIIRKTWKTATGIKNYILKNVLIDYLTTSRVKKTVPESNELSIMGYQFENIVCSLIKEKIPFAHIKNKSFEDTKTAMTQGIPIIFQGFLSSPSEKLKGSPDIIIRSDYIASIIKNAPEMQQNGCAFADTWHYRIIDIKFMTLNLSVDKNYLLQTPKTKIYKVQLFTYNLLLSEIQGYNPNIAYILGRRWKTSTEKCDNCFDMLAPIDFINKDAEIADIAAKSYDFYNKNNVSIPEDLYPNMKLQDYFDNGFTEEKTQIARSHAEITQIYHCGTTHRDNAINNGFDRWDHPNCNATTLGFRPESYLNNVVNNVITVNKSPIFTINPSPSAIKIPPIANVEFFVDFETAGDLVLEDFSQMPNAINSTRIYLIGVLKVINFKTSDPIVSYKSFITKDLSLEEERRNINKFISYIYTNSSSNSPLYHWGHIEASELQAACRRHPKARWNISNLNLIDFCDVLKKNKVAVKGTFNYKLKDIARALFSEGLIESTWETETKSGKSSLLSIKKIAEESKVLQIDIEDHKDFKDLLEYNKMDCIITYEIIDYFRKN